MNTITLPELNEGEIYAGILLNESGAPQHHLILLPGDNNGASWQTQIDWAKSIGGELPTRAEQSLLFANCKPHVQQDWYWSSEGYSAGGAWCQHFGNGYQNGSLKNGVLRARAVRRLIIE